MKSSSSSSSSTLSSSPYLQAVSSIRKLTARDFIERGTYFMRFINENTAISPQMTQARSITYKARHFSTIRHSALCNVSQRFLHRCLLLFNNYIIQLPLFQISIVKLTRCTISQIYFILDRTLQVSDGLSVRHQDSKTAHTA